MNPDDINLEAAAHMVAEQRIADQPESRNIADTVLIAAKRGMLQATMRAARGNQSKAARWLGLNRATLRAWLKECGLEKPCS